MINAYRASHEKSIENRPLEIPRSRWKNNFKMNLTEIRLEVSNGLIGLRMRTSGGLV